jgi:hypothetical protein
MNNPEIAAALKRLDEMAEELRRRPLPEMPVIQPRPRLKLSDLIPERTVELHCLPKRDMKERLDVEGFKATCDGIIACFREMSDMLIEMIETQNDEREPLRWFNAADIRRAAREAKRNRN